MITILLFPFKITGQIVALAFFGSFLKVWVNSMDCLGHQNHTVNLFRDGQITAAIVGNNKSDGNSIEESIILII